jgi:hypothetical protein
MTTLELKAELKKLIDKERSPKKLAAVRGLLVPGTKEERVRKAMVEAVLRSEEDIKAGRVHSLEEFGTIMKERVKMRYARKASARTKKGR